MARAKKNQRHQFPVKFSTVSIGESTARLGVEIARSAINLDTADHIFCGHRLVGMVRLKPKDELEGQGHLVDDLTHEVSGAFDCKGLRVTADSISTGLTFSLADIDIKELASMSKGQGTLVVDSIEPIPDKDDE